jgi:hypothetical protein
MSPGWPTMAFLTSSSLKLNLAQLQARGGREGLGVAAGRAEVGRAAADASRCAHNLELRHAHHCCPPWSTRPTPPCPPPTAPSEPECSCPALPCPALQGGCLPGSRPALTCGPCLLQSLAGSAKGRASQKEKGRTGERCILTRVRCRSSSRSGGRRWSRCVARQCAAVLRTRSGEGRRGTVRCPCRPPGASRLQRHAGPCVCLLPPRGGH